MMWIAQLLLLNRQPWGALFSARPDQQVYEPTSDTNKGDSAPAVQSLFHQRPEDFMLLYDDLPDEETMDETAAADSIKNLLLPSEQKLDRIEKYVKDNHVPKVLNSQELTENENLFTRNSHSYLLKDKHLDDVYEIIASLDDTNILAKTLRKRPSLLENLKATLKKNKHVFQHEVLKAMDQELICTLITKSMSLSLGHSLAKAAETAAAEKGNLRADSHLDDDKESVFEAYVDEQASKKHKKQIKKEFNPSKEIKNTKNIDFLKSTLASKIGHVIFESYVYLNHIYEVPEPTENEEYHSSSKKTKEFAKKTTPEISKLITKLKSTPKNKEPDVRHSTITATQELNFAIASYLSLYLNSKPESVMREVDFDQAEESLRICATRIGLEIIELLKNIGAVTEELSKQNHPHIILVK